MVHTRVLVIELVHRLVWSTNIEANNMKKVKKELLEKVFENISGRQFIDHCRWTCWSRGCLGRWLWTFHQGLLRNNDGHFIGGILPGIGNDAGIGHRIVHRVAG